jgi:hypothetical protein
MRIYEGKCLGGPRHGEVVMIEGKTVFHCPKYLPKFGDWKGPKKSVSMVVPTVSYIHKRALIIRTYGGDTVECHFWVCNDEQGTMLYSTLKDIMTDVQFVRSEGGYIE